MADFKLEAGSKIPEHPLLSYLKEHNASNVASVKGYVGPSTRDGYVRMYADLADLSDAVDIPRNDILYFAEAPDSVLPLGGTIVWLKKDAQVVVSKVETSALKPRAEEALELSRGRLRILVRGGLRSDVCQSRCQVCQSRCQVCQSRGSRFDLPGGFAFPQMRER
ncbi:hypothetical protein LPN04_10645 [Rugamonas sp. A1-17]|nr:hypothetical protein [Rugamonas sp. A1-17]